MRCRPQQPLGGRTVAFTAGTGAQGKTRHRLGLTGLTGAAPPDCRSARRWRHGTRPFPCIVAPQQMVQWHRDSTGYCPARLSRNRRRSRQHRPTGWRLRSQARSVVPRCGPSSSRAQKPRGACGPVRKWARTLRGCVAPSAPVKSGPDSRIGSQGSGDDGRCVGQWIRPGRHQPRL